MHVIRNIIFHQNSSPEFKSLQITLRRPTDQTNQHPADILKGALSAGRDKSTQSARLYERGGP